MYKRYLSITQINVGHSLDIDVREIGPVEENNLENGPKCGEEKQVSDQPKP